MYSQEKETEGGKLTHHHKIEWQVTILVVVIVAGLAIACYVDQKNEKSDANRHSIGTLTQTEYEVKIAKELNPIISDGETMCARYQTLDTKDTGRIKEETVIIKQALDDAEEVNAKLSTLNVSDKMADQNRNIIVKLQNYQDAANDYYMLLWKGNEEEKQYQEAITNIQRECAQLKEAITVKD